MKIVLCAPFMEADLWQERIERAVSNKELQIFEFNHPAHLLQVSGMGHCDLIWIVAYGARGMEDVRELKEKYHFMPIVWVSDDVDFWSIALKISVKGFLPKDYTDEQFERIIDQFVERRAV